MCTQNTSLYSHQIITRAVPLNSFPRIQTSHSSLNETLPKHIHQMKEFDTLCHSSPICNEKMHTLNYTTLWHSMPTLNYSIKVIELPYQLKFNEPLSTFKCSIKKFIT